MYVEPAMLLGDTWSVEAVRAAVDGLADRSVVVVRRDAPDRPSFYAMDVGAVRAALEGVEPDADLASVLGLTDFSPNPAVDLDDILRVSTKPAPQVRPGYVLLRNVDVLGLVRTDAAEGGKRGAHAERPAAPEPSQRDVGVHDVIGHLAGGAHAEPPAAPAPADDGVPRAASTRATVPRKRF